MTLAPAGAILATAAMTLLWRWQHRVQNARIAGVGWTALVAALAILDARLGDGWKYRRAAVGFMMGSWGLRLAVYLLYDRAPGQPEDGPPRRPFWFFQAHALAAVGFSLPALLAAANTDDSFSTLELIGAGLWAIAFAGESTADRQLLRFKSDASHARRVCRNGLWRFSRHPNYVFEWLIWIAFALFASASPWGWIAFACPLAMLYVLLRAPDVPEAFLMR